MHPSDGGQDVDSQGRVDRRRTLNRQLRIEFLVGAEESSQRSTGRSLTVEELRRIVLRRPGDLTAGWDAQGREDGHPDIPD